MVDQTLYFPWREALIILLLLWISAGMKYVDIKPQYIDFVAKYRWVRFSMVFMLSYLYFSLDFKVGDLYSVPIKLLVSFIVSFIYNEFLSTDAVFLTSS